MVGGESMPIKCPACAEENPDGAIMCELCQAVLRPLGSRTENPRPQRAASNPSAAEPAIPSVFAATIASRPAAPTSMPTDKPLAFQIPTAPPRRGRGGLIAGLIAGAGLALTAVAVMRPRPAPTPPAANTVTKTQVVYVQVPSKAPAQPNRAEDTPVPTRVSSASARIAETRPSHAEAVEVMPKQPQQMIVRYHGQDARTQRILVPITINGSATVMMALDTGAPSTLIAQSLAERLGVLRRDDGVLLTSASGIGGSTPAVLVVLESLGLGEARDEFVPATVTSDLSDNFAGLLGMDFITTFKLRVDTVHQVLILTKPDVGGNTPAGHDERWWRRLFDQFKDQRRRWENYRELIDKQVNESTVSAGPSIDRLRRFQAVAVSQVDEAGKLLQRLERHASNHAVPREWR